MYSLSEENYLKSIYHLEKQFSRGVSTNALAEQLETKASSVTDMVKKLSDKNLAVYKKYKGVTLSELGQKTALQIIRKHRLWEVFLVEKLNFSWDEVHDVAEQLEHIKSTKLIEELDKFLNYPQRDPHGDPIPDTHGKFKVANKTLLAKLIGGESGILVGVKDSSPDFLRYLDKHNIALGDHIEVKQKEEFDASMHLLINGQHISVSPVVASNIYIKI